MDAFNTICRNLPKLAEICRNFPDFPRFPEILPDFPKYFCDFQSHVDDLLVDGDDGSAQQFLPFRQPRAVLESNAYSNIESNTRSNMISHTLSNIVSNVFVYL